MSERAGLSAVPLLVYWPVYWGPRSPLFEKGLHALVTTFGERWELFLKYFLCSAEQCLDFCMKLVSAVRTDRQPSLFPPKLWKIETCSIPTSANWTSLDYSLDSEQNNKQINLNTSEIYSLSCAVWQFLIISSGCSVEASTWLIICLP